MSRRLPLALALLAASAPAGADIAGRPEVAAFVRELAARRHFDAAELARLFGGVVSQPRILAAMDHPAESKPWWQYRKILLDEAHVQGGVAFWRQYRAYLEEAESRYGVAPEMVVAIIGAESRYGEVLGNHRVVDALATLAFDYPRRAGYFRQELEEYLLMCREEGVDPAQPRGSYAGAMGMPQFMPGSYRQYAVDLDGDRKRNLWTNPADAIASVAHYFARAGWQRGGPVAFPARLAGEAPQNLAAKAGADYSMAELRGMGVESPAPLPEAARARLLALDGEGGPEYWLVLPNFQAITRYNHSPMYALAAFLLGQEILARRGW